MKWFSYTLSVKLRLSSGWVLYPGVHMMFSIPDKYLLSYFRHHLIFIMLTSRYMDQLTSKSGGVGGKPLFIAGCQLINAVGMMEVGLSHQNNNNWSIQE